jgi:hypothetical protein
MKKATSANAIERGVRIEGIVLLVKLLGAFSFFFKYGERCLKIKLLCQIVILSQPSVTLTRITAFELAPTNHISDRSHFVKPLQLRNVALYLLSDMTRLALITFSFR